MLENWVEISSLASCVTLGKSFKLFELLHKRNPILATLGNLFRVSGIQVVFYYSLLSQLDLRSGVCLGLEHRRHLREIKYSIKLS